MKKKLLVAVLFTAVMASCNKDQVLEVQQDAIKLRVAAENSTKAEEIYCANNLMADFMLYASHKLDGTYSNYIGGKKVNVAADKTCSFDNGSVHYWPNGTGATLDFFAVKNGEIGNWDNYGPKFSGDPAAFDASSSVLPTVQFKVVGSLEDDASQNDGLGLSDQKDLIYAVELDETKSETALALNFRHALSQIEFRALNKNSNLHITVQGVQVANVQGTGVYTLPYAATTENILDHNHDDKDKYYEDSRGKWSWTEDNYYTYQATFDAVELELDKIKSLTVTDDATKKGEYNANTMLLIPQEREAWAPNTNPTPTAEGNKNVYFMIDCTIHNIAGTEYNNNDVQLWTGYAAIPVKIDWKEGKKYVYTFVFDTDGTGGYDPNPEPGSEPEDVLTKISLTVSVDDFTDIQKSAVEMDR